MAKRFSFPEMQEYTLRNGLRVILIPHTEQDGLVFALQFPFGRFSDRPGSEGCTELCMGLMQKGTTKLSSEQLTDTFEHHGASLFSEAGEEHAMIGIKMLSRFKDTLLPVFWDMVVAPGMEPVEFTRLQNEMYTALKAEAVDPGSIANRHFYHELAGGSAHPAGRHHSLQSIKKVTIDDVREYYKMFVKPLDCVLVVAGNFSPEWFATSCLPFITPWSNLSDQQPFDAPAVIQRDAAIRFIEKNDLTQVSMIIGQSAPGELHPDRNRIALANYILGAGNFSSRLMNRIRSDAGRTYSISSHITAERNFGALTIGTSTQNRQLTEVFRAIKDEFSKFCSKGITQPELATVKKFAIGNMAFQLEGLTNFVEKMLWLSFYHRSVEYIETFDTMINSISLDSVNEAVHAAFNPEKLIVVAVGNKKETLSQLAAFGNVKEYYYKDPL